MPRLTGALAGAILVLAACAAHAEPEQPGHEQGLGLLPRSLPDELKKAQADPYAPPGEPVCANIDSELASLEQILGPDVDAVQAKDNKAKDLISDAVRGAIPYRSWIRKITGAERSEKKRDHALLAAWERRGYLKGLAREKQCIAPMTTAEQPPAADTAEAAPPPMPGEAARAPASDAADQGVPASATAPTAEAAISPPEPLPPAEPAGAADEAEPYAPAPEPEGGR